MGTTQLVVRWASLESASAAMQAVLFLDGSAAIENRYTVCTTCTSTTNTLKALKGMDIPIILDSLSLTSLYACPITADTPYNVTLVLTGLL